jgi:hypothetical protein
VTAQTPSSCAEPFQAASWPLASSDEMPDSTHCMISSFPLLGSTWVSSASDARTDSLEDTDCGDASSKMRLMHCSARSDARSDVIAGMSGAFWPSR